MKKWFLCADEEVSGPFSEDELRANDTIPSTTLVWGTPLTQWLSYTDWSKNINHIKAEIKELKRTQKTLWHFAVNKESFGPFDKSELIEALNQRDHKDHILLWTKGYKKWVSIFECHDILDDLGINRRKEPRALLSGHVVIKKDGFSVISQITTISAGGVGCNAVNGLEHGASYEVEIRSPEFHNNIQTTCEARYISDSHIGFKFEQIHAEAKSTIINYIKTIPAAKAA